MLYMFKQLVRAPFPVIVAKPSSGKLQFGRKHKGNFVFYLLILHVSSISHNMKISINPALYLDVHVAIVFYLLFIVQIP